MRSPCNILTHPSSLHCRLLYFLTSAPLLIAYIYSYWFWADSSATAGMSDMERARFFWTACTHCTLLPLAAALLLKRLKFIRYFFSENPSDNIPLILVMSVFLFWHYYVLTHNLSPAPPLITETAFTHLASACLALPLSKIKSIDSRLLTLLPLLLTLLLHTGNAALPVPLITYTLLAAGSLASWKLYRQPENGQSIYQSCQIAAIATLLTEIIHQAKH